MLIVPNVTRLAEVVLTWVHNNHDFIFNYFKLGIAHTFLI